MTKVLYIGDAHAEVSSLNEMKALVDYIYDIAQEHKPDFICFLGDQTNNHSILHLSVLEFWRESFAKLHSICDIIVLVGNHDRSGIADSYENSMNFFQGITPVATSIEKDGLLFVGYQSDPAEFVRFCKQSKCSMVVCHQTFIGATYENGFPAEDGINPDDIPQKQIISGHIHTPQNVGKLWYVGAPRWRTASDVNVERNLWLVTHKNGEIVDKRSFATAGICRPMYSVEVTPEKADFEVPAQWLKEKAKILIDISGPIDFCTVQSAKFTELGCRVRTFPEKNYINNIKESEGLVPAFTKFISNFTPKNGTDLKLLAKLVGDRISWMKQ